MLRAQKLLNLNKIVEIRKIEKSIAEQALVAARDLEAERLSEMESAEEDVVKSHAQWEEHLNSGSVITEHLKYYSNDLVIQMENHKQKEAEYSRSSDESDSKMFEVQTCDVIVKNTSEMQAKLKRKVTRDRDERAINIFEDRYSYLWSRK